MRRTASAVTLALLVPVLSAVTAAPSDATVSGRDGRIAFVRENQIYTMSPAGTRVKRLTWSGKNYRPKWSPDGRRIAYLHEDADGSRNLVTMRQGGSDKTRLTISGTVTTAAAWSPDGRTIAFAQTGTVAYTPWCFPTSCPDQGPRDRDGNFVYLVGIEGPADAPAPLSVFPSYLDAVTGPDLISAYEQTSLAWSPDGYDLAILNGDSEDSPDTGLHLVHEMTGATAQDAATTARPEDVAFATGGDCCGYLGWSDLNYRPDGVLGLSVLDRGDELQYDPPRASLDFPGFASLRGDRAGAPSPSGRRLVFVRAAGGVRNIWTASASGEDREQILTNGYQPDWQPRQDPADQG